MPRLDRVKLKEVSKTFIAAYLREEQILRRYGGIVQDFDFDAIQPGTNALIASAYEFYRQYKYMPDAKAYTYILDKVPVDPENKTLLSRMVNESYTVELRTSSYMVDAFRDEIVSIMLKANLDSQLSKLNNQEASTTISEIHGFLKRAESLYIDENAYDYADTFALRESLRKRRIEEIGMHKLMKLGIKDLDSQKRYEPGTITAFLAPYKRYKSIALTHAGWAALLQGYNVLHVNYEGRKEMWENRYDAKFSDIEESHIANLMRTEEEQQRLVSVMNRINNWDHRLFLVRGKPNKTNADDIEQIIDNIRYETGVEIDVIIIDYFQIMGSNTKSKHQKDDWLLQGDIGWDLVNLALHPGKNRIVFGALQTDRSGINAKELKSSNYGRSILIPQAIDNLIAINQTKDEKNEGTIRFSPLFFREGEITKPDCKVWSELYKINIAKESSALWDDVVDDI